MMASNIRQDSGNFLRIELEIESGPGALLLLVVLIHLEISPRLDFLISFWFKIAR